MLSACTCQTPGGSPPRRDALSRLSASRVVGVLSTAVTIYGFFEPEPPKYDACNATAPVNASASAITNGYAYEFYAD